MGASSAIVIINGVPTSWTAYAHAQKVAWDAIDRSRSAVSQPIGTRADLEVFVATLVKFGKAAQRLRFVPGGLRPPPGSFAGAAHLGIVHAGAGEAPAGPTVAVVSSPPSPPVAPRAASDGRGSN